MLWTLWRAILADLWRLLLLSTAVLVLVVAFAATVKPLADGKLTADQAIRFMFYAIPPMLAYALPFAGGFAATLAFHRLASDNEVTAAKAGGIGYRRILFPAVISGSMIAGGLWVLNDRVIPVFLTRMQEMITRDFAGLMVASLSQGESAMIGNTEIHADQVQQVEPSPDSPVLQQFLLAGVAMVETDNNGNILIDGTAKQAWIQMRPVWSLTPQDRARIKDDDATAVILKFYDVTIYRDGAPQSADPLVAPAIPIPKVFEDDPKFASGAEMREIKRNPDSMSFVARRRTALARSLAAQLAYVGFDRDLRAGHAIELTSIDGSIIRVLGQQIQPNGGDWGVLPVRETGVIEVEIVSPTGRTDRLRAEQGSFAMQTPTDQDPFADRSSGASSRFRLKLDRVRVLGAGTESGTELATTTYADLSPADDPMRELMALKSPELLERAKPFVEQNDEGVIATMSHALEREIAFLQREVLSKQHERLAMSAQCLVMVILGAVMALRLSDSTPLIVYLWSFFPALLSVVLLESGQQLVHDQGLIGLPLLWGAIVGLAALAFAAYRGLSRL
ncbi:MAG: LptF/LptG family permease [Phycisphaerales bacterium]